MKYLWSNNKDKMVLSEEGQVDENLERVRDTKKSKTIMSILQYVLVILLIAATSLMIYKIAFSKSAAVDKTESESFFMSAPHVLNPTSENEDSNLKIHSASPSVDSPNLLEKHENKNDLQKIEPKKEVIEEISKHKDDLKSDMKQEIPNDDALKEVNLKKIIFFRIPLPPIAESEEEEENKNSQIDEPKSDTFHFRILFKNKDLNKNDKETNGKIVDDTVMKPMKTFPKDIPINNHPLNHKINNDNQDDFQKLWNQFEKNDPLSKIFNNLNETLNKLDETLYNYNETSAFYKFLEDKVLNKIEPSETSGGENPLSFDNIWKNLNLGQGNYDYDETSNFDSQEYNMYD